MARTSQRLSALAGRPSFRSGARSSGSKSGGSAQSVYHEPIEPLPSAEPSRPSLLRAYRAMPRPALAVLLSCAALATASHARAQQEEEGVRHTTNATLDAELEGDGDLLRRSPKRGFAALNRPAGIAEFGVGWLTLPAAEVCIEAQSCQKGDTTPQLDAWQFFRLNVDFALGAGITLGLLPTRDSPPVDPPGIERSHQRRYFMFETMGRYYLYVGETFEAWTGLATGLTVVKDTYVTEGYTVSLGVGAAFMLAPSWSFGVALRAGSWFLPEEAKRGPFDSESESALGATRATLTGRNSVISLGFSIAYRTML